MKGHTPSTQYSIERPPLPPSLNRKKNKSPHSSSLFPTENSLKKPKPNSDLLSTPPSPPQAESHNPRSSSPVPPISISTSSIFPPIIPGDRSTHQSPSRGATPRPIYGSPVREFFYYDTPITTVISTKTPDEFRPGFITYTTENATKVSIRHDLPLSSGSNKSVYTAFYDTNSGTSACIAIRSEAPIRCTTTRQGDFGILGNFFEPNSGQHFQIIKRGIPLNTLVSYLNNSPTLAGVDPIYKLAVILSSLPRSLENIDILNKTKYPHQDIKPSNLVFLPDEKLTIVIDFDALEHRIHPPRMFTESYGSPMRGTRPSVDEAGIFGIAKSIKEFCETLNILPPEISAFITQNLDTRPEKRQSPEEGIQSIQIMIRDIKAINPVQFEEQTQVIYSELQLFFNQLIQESIR